MKQFYCMISNLTKVEFFQVNKNAMLCKSIDELFEKGMNEVDQSDLKELMQKVSYTYLARMS